MNVWRTIGGGLILAGFLCLRLNCGAPPGRASSGDLLDPAQFQVKTPEIGTKKAPVLVTDDREAIRPGARGEKVRFLQQFLKDVKLYNGEITGVYDNATVGAVKTFQRTFNLKANGVIGVKTAKAIAQVMEGNVS